MGLLALLLGFALLGAIALLGPLWTPSGGPDTDEEETATGRATDGEARRTETPPRSPIAGPGFYPARYGILASYTENPRAISGTQKVRYVNAEGRPMRSLFFRLWTNEEVFADLGGGTEVSRAIVGGRPARLKAGEDDGTILEVIPETPIPDGATSEVVLDFATRVPEIPAPFGHSSGVTALGVWHPVLAIHENGEWDLPPAVPFGEPYRAEAADYEVSLTLPEGDLVPVATGAEKGSKAERDGGRTVTYEAEAARDFALAIGEDLTKISREVGPTTVSVYYRSESEYRAEAALDLAAGSLAFYSNLYGPYPYPELAVVDAPLIAGTEYSALTFANLSGVDDVVFDAVIPHEVAHQWWYVLVGTDQYATPWLDESLATYSEWLYTGDAATRFPNPVTPSAPLGSPVTAFPDTAAYQDATYLRGAQVLRELSYEIGDKALATGLKRYAEEHRHGLATERDLVDALSEAADEDLAPFFEAQGVSLNDGPQE